VSFRREFGHLCVERRSNAANSACSATSAADPESSHCHHLLRVDDISGGLSNLRLSSSAPSSSSSFLDSCASSLRGAPARRPAAGVDAVSPTPAAARGCVAGSARSFPVRVLNNLFLGDAATARDLDCLRRHNIEYIVNVTADVENAFEDDATLTYMRIAITDHWSETPTSFFTAAINFIGLHISHWFLFVRLV